MKLLLHRLNFVGEEDEILFLIFSSINGSSVNEVKDYFYQNFWHKIQLLF